MKRIILSFFILLCFPLLYGNAESNHSITYDEYMRNPDYYTDRIVSIENLTVWRFTDNEIDSIQVSPSRIKEKYPTIYACGENQREMFAAIPKKPLGEFLWYAYGDATVGMTGELYITLPEDVRLYLQPIKSIERLVKGDSIAIYGMGDGLTESSEPRIIVTMIWINP